MTERERLSVQSLDCAERQAALISCPSSARKSIKTRKSRAGDKRPKTSVQKAVGEESLDVKS